MNTFQETLEKYADLAIKTGINLQKDQILSINASITAAEFTRIVVKKAYEAGAKDVHVFWSDDAVTRLKYDLAPDEAFTEFPSWLAKSDEEIADKGGAFLSIRSANPDLLNGIDPERIANAAKAQGKARETFRRYIQSDKVSWSIVAVPSDEWAQKVFPNEPNNVEKLWKAIFQATRADLDNPVEAWKEHCHNLQVKADFLNKKKYKKLHFQAEGTDLTIEFSPKHLWAAGGSVNEQGHAFVANIPTEEIFTLPLKEGVNGYVTSKKPLSYSGNIIENFTLTFEKGRIVDFKAETGYETLKRLIETDEGSHYLGEVALVPHHSPISDSKIIYYNTLFDENASVHLAIGSAYAFCLEGGKTMSQEELIANGANKSLTHVDFMIGCADMAIDGETLEGNKEPLFRNGDWAI